MDNPLQEVTDFFAGWPPYAEMPSRVLPGQIITFLTEEDPQRRREILTSASPLFRLHERYRELEMFRPGRNERAEQFQVLLGLSLEDLARSIREKRQKEHLVLIQYCFEFGRHEVSPRNDVVREFLHTALSLPIGENTMKYSLFAGNVLYSSGGKTHDEMAVDFKNLGLAAQPLCGGMLKRTAPLELHYDVSSSAYRTGDPGQVRDAMQRAIRASGGDEDKLVIKLEERV